MMDDKELREKAEKRAEEKIGFYTHLTVYIVVNLFLIIIWFFNGGSSWFSKGEGVFPWFIFPLFGWGIGISAHFVGVFTGGDFKDKIAEKEYEKLKEKK
ncbi:MAG: 2TM domain-containing protein [Candidatus Thermoplasmatota archaeon]